MRAAGLVTDYPLTPAKPDRQFKRAQELKAAHTAKVVNPSTVRIRDSKTREETTAGIAEAAHRLSRGR